MSDKPRISVVVQCDGRHVVAKIAIDRPINGFYGCNLAYDLDWTPNQKTKTDLEKLDREVKERVLWKIAQETGLPDTWKAEDLGYERIT